MSVVYFAQESYMNIETWAVSKAIPYPGNPRIISEAAIQAVANSIREFGFRQPIVVDKDGVIIVGHIRREAAILLDLKTVPVHVARDMSPEQASAYRLADNRSGELADWDIGTLQEELRSQEILNMADFGFSDAELMLAEVDEGEIMAGNVPETDDLLFGAMMPDKRPRVTVSFLNDGDVENFLKTMPEDSSFRRMPGRGEANWVAHIPAKDKWPEFPGEPQDGDS